VKQLSKFEKFFWDFYGLFYLPFLVIALWSQRLPTTTMAEALVIVPWSILCMFPPILHRDKQIIDDKQQTIARLQRALETATWAICALHKEDNVKP
jgi:hypothetical protein